ncbi:MAG: tRNA dihydrouridine(20/20a) synthase DusA [Succinivibrio sp.]
MPNHCIFTEADRFSVAPMIDVTNRTFRQMARIFSKKAMLYTEMIAAQALTHGKEHLIEHDDPENPCTLQLGGSIPKVLASASKIGQKHGYSAINLNAGCPSDKVQSGSFGAILMKTPEVITDCIKAMQDAVDIPVTVKTRIGVDDLDDEEYTKKIVNSVYCTGSRHIILHARKAWLNGLSPKENRTVPPLDYQRVYALKNDFPDLAITINGGILTIEDCLMQLKKVEGVMLGRAIMDNPYLLAFVDRDIYGENVEVPSRDEIFFKIVEFGKDFVARGNKLHYLGNHVINLFNGCKGARRFRNYLSCHMHETSANVDVFEKAYESMKLA